MVELVTVVLKVSHSFSVVHEMNATPLDIIHRPPHSENTACVQLESWSAVTATVALGLPRLEAAKTCYLPNCSKNWLPSGIVHHQLIDCFSGNWLLCTQEYNHMVQNRPAAEE